MSIGAAAAGRDVHPVVPFLAFAVAIGALLASALAVRAPLAGAADALSRGPLARAVLALAVAGVVIDRHLFVASTALAPDDVLAAAAVLGALLLPSGARWRALAAALAVATYVVVGATFIAATPYRSDAVVAAHGAAELLLAGRDPYADFDMVERLARFGLPDSFATPLEDGTRLRALQYPALAFLVPAPLVAAGLGDVRALYLAEVVAIVALAALAAPPRWRTLAVAAGIGNAAILDQAVLAGVDPLWALLALAAFLARERRWSAVLLGLSVAARQPAWLVAPFLVVEVWRRDGPREAFSRAAIALAVAVAAQVPFLVTAPAVVVGGITAPAILPLEPHGVGPSGIGAAGILPLLPRAAYLGAAALAYLAALWAFATGRARGALTLPLFPLWLAWRALQSYFAVLPLFAVAEDGAGARGGRSRM